MKILNGINDGMVMQRGTATNECDILLSLECDGEPAAKYDDGKAVSLTREGDHSAADRHTGRRTLHADDKR